MTARSWPIGLTLCALVLCACGTAPSSDGAPQTQAPRYGRAEFDLQLPNGEMVSTIDLYLVCQGIDQHHELEVTNGHVTAAFGGLTPGECSAEMTAVTPEGTDCYGAQDFVVIENETTLVVVTVLCQGKDESPSGSLKLDTDYDFYSCSEDRIRAMYAIPVLVPLGERTVVQAESWPSAVVGNHSWSFEAENDSSHSAQVTLSTAASCAGDGCIQVTCDDLGASAALDPNTGYFSASVKIKATFEDDECYDRERLQITCYSVCGDGSVSGDEQCDDGNLEDNDGCNGQCELEICRDDIVNQSPGIEVCDGAAGLLDPVLQLCDPDCQIVPICGNTYLEDGELCDDGNTDAGDGCSPACTPEPIQLATGGGHSCALFHGGAVKCWGSNNFGQLGVGDTIRRGDNAGEMGDNLATVDLGSGRAALQLAAGDNHTCALLDDGSVKCWGYNVSGQLGLGDTQHRGDAAAEMGDNLPSVDLGAGHVVQSIAASDRRSCALFEEGTVKCWGDNFYGHLGLGDTQNRGDAPGEMGDNLPLIDVGTAHTVQSLVPAENHTCALLDDDTVKCWGHNLYGQLGLADIQNRGDEPGEMGDDLPVVNLGSGRFAQTLTAGVFHTCALLDDDTVKCWGNAAQGQLGLGSVTHRGDTAGEMGDSLPIVDLGSGRTALTIEAGGFHNCALLDDGSVKCWGYNLFGQLGLGNTVTRGDNAGEMGNSLPAVSLGSGVTVQSLAAGTYFSCALFSDRSVKCWGVNGAGQLGLQDTAHRGDGAGEMGDSLPALVFW